ncbi:MAG: phage minor head protein [Halanaerobiales bacterium]
MPQMDLFDEFNRLQRQIDNIEDSAKRKIAREYANGLEKLRNIVRKKYDKYGVDGELTYQEMAKYDRIKKLDKEVADAVKDMHVQTSKITRSSLRDTYKSTFSGVKESLEIAADRTIKGQIKREVINEALQNPVSGLTLNDRLRRRRRDIIVDIQETIGQGLYRGESYTDMSKRLKETLEGDVVKANRIVSTETHRVMEKSKSKAADYATNQGVKMKKYWQDSGDEAVRDSHRHMAEKYNKDNAIPVDEDFVNDKTGGKGPAPGQLGVAKDDIYCRCIAIYIVITQAKAA